jgi:hypothetical protein
MKYHLQSKDGSAIPNETKIMTSFGGAGYLGKNDLNWEQANSTGVPPNQKSTQSRATNLSLQKHWFSTPLSTKLECFPQEHTSTRV